MERNVKTTILLVEDETIIALSEKKQLENIGYIVHHVLTGKKAINSALNNNYDLILMDIDLGTSIDGTQAAEEILKGIDIPVVFLSSHTEPEIVEKTQKITFYGYVVKNSGIVVLDASIKMALKLFNEKIKNKEAKEALRKQRERIDLAMENISAGIWEYYIENDYMRWSEELYNIFDLPKDKPAPTFSEQKPLYTEDSFAKLQKSVHECFVNETPYDINLDIITAKGFVKNIISKGIVRKDYSNKVIGCFGTAQDITTIKTATFSTDVKGEFMGIEDDFEDITEYNSIEESFV